MSDLISKNQSLVEWKEDFKGYVECLDIPRDDYKGIMAYIDEVPSAEPEIIRCRDCKNHVLHPRIGVPWCKLLHSDMGDNQFCSYAERREVIKNEIYY